MAKDYIKFIIESWVQNAQKIGNIFYREFKASDKEDIPPDELFDYLIKAVDLLEQQRQRPYHKQLELWNDFVISKEAKGEDFNMPMPEDNYTLATSHLTDFRICLHLSKGDLLYIKESIEIANLKYKTEHLKNGLNIKDSFVEAYCNEVTPERIAELKEQLSKIEPYSKRIEFLNNYKIKYLQEISPESLFISGVTSTAMGTKAALFLDKFIELEIENERLKSTIAPETKTEQETFTFTNNFDNISTTEIYSHFKAGLVDKRYLTEQELKEYLKAAFELRRKPKTLFKLKHTPTKQKIYTVFYVYYKDISQKKHDRQREYAALLGDYFEGYKTETIQTNWARDYKTKR